VAQHDPDAPPAPTLQVFHRESRPNLSNRSLSGINESADLNPKRQLRIELGLDDGALLLDA
jgi:hypothetical protein